MTTPPNQVIDAARKRTKLVLEAVEASDVEAFKAALFDEEPGVVSQQMAGDLRYGFHVTSGGQNVVNSLVELCFFNAQVEMLRVALEARHPEMVDGLLTGSQPAWLSHLGTSYFRDFGSVSLPALACWHGKAPHAMDFLMLGLEHAPEDAGAEALEANDATSAAMMRAARMRLRLETGDSQPQAVPEPAPQPRRNRLV